MPSLKAIRKRIASVKNTQKITKAMKMVATAKLRRAQDAVKAIRPYANHLGDIAEDLATRLLAEPASDEVEAQGDPLETGGPSLALLHKILVGGTDKRVRLVVVSADKNETVLATDVPTAYGTRFLADGRLLVALPQAGEEIAIDATSVYAGKFLKDTNLMSELSLIVVAIRRKDGELSFHPNGETLIDDGDLLIVIGKAESVKRLMETNNK